MPLNTCSHPGLRYNRVEVLEIGHALASASKPWRLVLFSTNRTLRTASQKQQA
jgi:hypothetical protein